MISLSGLSSFSVASVSEITCLEANPLICRNSLASANYSPKETSVLLSVRWYDINREAAKTPALSLGKIDKYEYLTGEEILPSNQKTNNRTN